MRLSFLSARTGAFFVIVAWLLVSGCSAVNTFPMAARPGDTISVMIGGSEQARKETISVMMADAAGGMYDLQAMGLVRSVFNLRPDGRAHGMYYSNYLDLYFPWEFGHEPVQTVLVADIPATVQPGDATLTISLNVPDNSSGIADPTDVSIEILSGVGRSDSFLRKSISSGYLAADLEALEPAPHAKLTFGNDAIIGAASLVLEVNESVVNLDDLSVYAPEATVRGSISVPGAFGDKQRMVYWRHDGGKLYIDVIAPQGIQARFLQLYVIHPRGLIAEPGFLLVDSEVFDVQGYALSVLPKVTYFSQ